MANVRNSRSSFWGFPSNPFADRVQDLEGDVPLEDLSNRLQVETGSQNRQAVTAVTTDENLTIKRIKDGLYYCSTCRMQITAKNTQEHNVWQCNGCHNILHLRCASRWAESSRSYSGDYGSIGYWSCSQCMRRQYTAPIATCWCGNFTHSERAPMDSQLSDVVPNGCRTICRKVGECIHKNRTRACDKPCHPGPCNSPCGTHCLQQLVTIARDNTPPNWWRKTYHKLRARWLRRANKGNGWAAWLVFFLVVVYYGTCGIYAQYHIKWKTQPLNYRQFTEVWASRDSHYTTMLMIVGLVTGLPMVFVFVLCCGSVLYYRVTHLLNCNDLSTKRHSKQLTKLSIWLVFATVFGCFIAMVPSWFIFGSNVAWYNQMKDSCNGLDTRAYLNKGNGTFEFDSITGLPQKQSFSLASRHDIAKHSTRPFVYFERFSGGSDMKRNHFVVDVDIQNGIWRLLHTSGPDLANDYFAAGMDKLQNHMSSKMLVPPTIYNEHIKNGTFYGIKSPVDNSRPRHMHIPELNFYVANMYDFMYNEAYEPFLRVFRAFGRSVEELLEVAEQKWTDKNDASVMMRTASFGHGRGPLSMCLREGQFDRYAANEMQESVSEDVLITFAIITAHWTKYKEMKVREVEKYRQID